MAKISFFGLLVGKLVISRKKQHFLYKNFSFYTYSSVSRKKVLLLKTRGQEKDKIRNKHTIFITLIYYFGCKTTKNSQVLFVQSPRKKLDFVHAFFPLLGSPRSNQAHLLDFRSFRRSAFNREIGFELQVFLEFRIYLSTSAVLLLNVGPRISKM